MPSEKRQGWKPESNPRVRSHYFKNSNYSICRNGYCSDNSQLSEDMPDEGKCKMCQKILRQESLKNAEKEKQ